MRIVTSSGKNLKSSHDEVGFYTLANKFCLTQLQDSIMDRIYDFDKKENLLMSCAEIVRA